MFAGIKQGPNRAYIAGLRPEMAIAFIVACFVYETYDAPSCILTEAVGARHSRGSLHFVGQAIDLRRPFRAAEVTDALKEHLGPDFDVVLEDDHIHIEFQPKVGVNQ